MDMKPRWTPVVGVAGAAELVAPLPFAPLPCGDAVAVPFAGDDGDRVILSRGSEVDASPNLPKNPPALGLSVPLAVPPGTALACELAPAFLTPRGDERGVFKRRFGVEAAGVAGGVAVRGAATASLAGAGASDGASVGGVGLAPALAPMAASSRDSACFATSARNEPKLHDMMAVVRPHAAEPSGARWLSRCVAAGQSRVNCKLV